MTPSQTPSEEEMAFRMAVIAALKSATYSSGMMELGIKWHGKVNELERKFILPYTEEGRSQLREEEEAKKKREQYEKDHPFLSIFV